MLSLAVGEETLGGFFGDAIRWRAYGDGYDEIAKQKKPGMVVFHRSYCSACDRLGSEVKENEELIELSKQFVMISCNQEGPCEDDAFAIGGVACLE